MAGQSHLEQVMTTIRPAETVLEKLYMHMQNFKDMKIVPRTERSASLIRMTALEGLRGLVVIDEVQRAPELFTSRRA